MAPEMFTQDKFLGKPLDMWAVGCTLYCFVTGEPPFKGDEASIRKSIQQDEYLFL